LYFILFSLFSSYRPFGCAVLELHEKTKIFAAVGKEKEHVLPIFSAKSENDIANLHECTFSFIVYVY
jgi:hypothetical protein